MHPLQTTIDQYAAQFDRRRMTILAAHVEEDNGTVLRGRVLDRSQHTALLALLPNVRDELIVLREQPEHGFATVAFGVLDVRWQATRDSELVTEASFGEGLEVLAHDHEWLQVITSDGYLGWVRRNGVVLHDQPSTYRSAATHVVTSRWLPLWGLEGDQIGLLPWGIRLEIDEFRDGKAFMRSPAGVPGWLEADSLTPVEDLCSIDSAGIEDMLQAIRQLIGVPYLWGGTTSFGFDCSGLAQAAYRWLGVQLPRDADQQSQIGHLISREQVAAGDLLFWGVLRNIEDYRHERINHVSIALDNEWMIHANQRNWSISLDRIDEVHEQVYQAQGNPGLVVIRRIREEQ